MCGKFKHIFIYNLYIYIYIVENLEKYRFVQSKKFRDFKANKIKMPGKVAAPIKRAKGVETVDAFS